MKIVKYNGKYMFTHCTWFEFIEADHQEFYVQQHYNRIHLASDVYNLLSEDDISEVENEFDAAIKLIEKFFTPCHDENIYGLPLTEQSLHENR